MAQQPSDPLFPQQWHLSGTSGSGTRISEVWTDYTGRGVRVAVLDDGFDETHADLVANYRQDLSYDFVLNQAGAAAVNADDNHGTATLGLIAAARNGIGGVGVAYDVEAIGYRIDLSETVTASGQSAQFAAATMAAINAGAAITSNSWGTADMPFSSMSEYNQYSSAASTAAQVGRGGLGMIQLFAAGNGREDGEITTYDPVVNSPFAIVVAAAKQDGTVTSYSTPGSSILVAAPGSDPASIVTTDRMGEAGYNTAIGGDYTDTPASAFNGTSAATPIAAGVVALMLEANANLGYRDVQEILAYSARSGNLVSNNLATFTANGAKDWNGGGHFYNTDSGYGNIDALAAVRLAETWTKVSNIGTLEAAEAEQSVTNDLLLAGQTQTYDITFDTALRIEHMQVSFSLTTADLAGAVITLTGPDGQIVSPVLVNGPSMMASSLNFVTDFTGYWGQSSTEGTWQLSVTAGAQDLGVSWMASAMGEAESANQTYIYTDDFGYYGVAGSGRGLLDNATGIHTINAAAVTSDSTIDLRDGMVGQIAGQSFSVSDATVIERVYAGDGNDMLFGSEADDMLFGGRGNNMLDGGDGVDTAGYLFSRTGYSLTFADGTYTVTDLNRGTADTLVNMEKALFTEGTLALRGLTDQAITIDGLYKGLLDRDLDGGGMRFWTDAAVDQSVSLNSVAASFTGSEEFQSGALFSAADDVFVDAMYTRLLGRDGEDDGMAFWTQALANGVQRSDLALDFITSGEFRLTQMAGSVQDIANAGDIWA